MKLTFWGYNRLNAILDHFRKPSSKHDETTASSGQSINTQFQKNTNKPTTKKLAKNRSRRFTAEKRNRTQDSQIELGKEEEDENRSVMEEEKKL